MNSTIDTTITDVKPEDFDGLLLPGGFSPDELRADDRFVNFVKAFLLDDKPVLAICHGPQFFIQTGYTKGRTMTAYTTVRPALYYAGAIVKNEPVVRGPQFGHQPDTGDLPDQLGNVSPVK